MKQILAVGLGGFLGSVARFGLGKWILSISKLGFPFHTLIINIIGCLLIGILTPQILKLDSDQFPVSEFILVGMLGGFTTFSTFGYECVHLLKQNESTSAVLYVLLSVGLGITAVWLGWVINR